MVTREISLKGARQRRAQGGFLHFVEALQLHLAAGYDLAYGWSAAAAGLSAVAPELAAELRGDGGPLSARLETLGKKFSQGESRVWFFLILALYREGSPLLAAVRSLRDRLRVEQEEALQRFVEEYPMKASLVLLLAFLPATFLLLIYPLLIDALRL